MVDERALIAETLARALSEAGVDVGLVRPATLERVRREVLAYLPDALLIGDVAARPALIRAIVNTGVPILVLADTEARIDVAECLAAGAIGPVPTRDDLRGLLEKLQLAVARQRILSPANERELMAELEDHRRDMDERDQPFLSLTTRESEVLMALMEGRAVVQIAEDSYTAVTTIRSHIQAILRKLDVNSQTAAVALAYRAGWQPERGSQPRR